MTQYQDHTTIELDVVAILSMSPPVLLHCLLPLPNVLLLAVELAYHCMPAA